MAATPGPITVVELLRLPDDGLRHELAAERLPPRRPRHNPRAVKRQMSNFLLTRPAPPSTTNGPPAPATRSIRILHRQSHWYWG